MQSQEPSFLAEQLPHTMLSSPFGFFSLVACSKELWVCWIAWTRLSTSVLDAPCLWFADPGVTMLCCWLICIALRKRSSGATASIAVAAAPWVDRPSMLVLTISIPAAAATRLGCTDVATRRSSPSYPVANPKNTHTFVIEVTQIPRTTLIGHSKHTHAYTHSTHTHITLGLAAHFHFLHVVSIGYFFGDLIRTSSSWWIFPLIVLGSIIVY